MSTADSHVSGKLFRFQTPALALGALGLLGCIAGFATNTDQFYKSYLVGFIYVATIPIGCLALLMIQYLSGGQWGLIIRRHLEASAKTLPLIFVFSLPVLLGLSKLFKWADASFPKDHILKHKEAYLSPGFFSARMLLYFLLWAAFAFLLNRWARKQDEYKDMRLRMVMHNVSGLGLAIMALTLTFAATDWIMSLEYYWSSTMLPVILMAGCLIIGIAFTIIVVANLVDVEPYATVVKKKHFHDYGNLLLAFTMFWTYCSISQLLITWSGNLREETPWYLKRFHGEWGYVAGALLLFHFFFPFFLLLQKGLKRDGKKLVYIALFVFLVRFLDYYWLVAPAFGGPSHDKANFHLHWLDLAAPMGLVGIWFGVYLWLLKGSPLLPVYDTHLEELYHGE